SPKAMNELRNGWPSTVPRTLIKPRVPKNAAESGITTYVQPPFAGDFCSFALNCLSIWRETFAICVLPSLPSDSSTDMSVQEARDRQVAQQFLQPMSRKYRRAGRVFRPSINSTKRVTK